MFNSIFVMKDMDGMVISGEHSDMFGVITEMKTKGYTVEEMVNNFFYVEEIEIPSGISYGEYEPVDIGEEDY